MSNARKPHRKSHKGCVQCKRRHVRCGEEKPICSACDRLDLICKYDAAPRMSVHSASPQPSGFSLLDMELLHHYHTCSCVRFAPQSVRHKCWTSDVPRIAFAHPFLLHQILAVAALHRYVQEFGSRALKTAATSHRALALEMVQPELSSSASEVGIALFAFAVSRHCTPLRSC